jgi:periplasmic glucans biosynthesis protein
MGSSRVVTFDMKSFKTFWILSLSISLIALTCPDSYPFDYTDVEKRARDLAQRPYRASEDPLPSDFPKIDYEAYRRIQFNHKKAIWADTSLPFRLETFHRGYIFPDRVRIHTITEEGQPILIPYSPDLFFVQKDPAKPFSLPPLSSDIGFSGVRIHNPVNGKWADEIAVFQGASYFRMKGKGQDYGLSARGLAIDTTTGSEEFPAFEEIWILRPRTGDAAITVFALLNGPACSGAYEFRIKPGRTTTADVKAKVFFRHGVKKVGLAPLTSMFWYGENTFSRPPEYRPEVHDSDGLLMASSDGTWSWRPLQTLSQHLVDHYRLDSPLGFGLLQRDRAFSSYRDLEATSHLRPSLWVEPKGDWGKGHVVLWHIPTTNEYADNIVAFWAPDSPPRGGDILDVAYRLHWTSEEPPGHTGGRVFSSHLLNLYGDVDLYRFLIDFAPLSKKKAITKESSPPRAKILVPQNGTLLENYVKANPDQQTWRLVFVVRLADPQKPTDLQCFLEDGQGRRTETWKYTLVPQPPLPK